MVRRSSESAETFVSLGGIERTLLNHDNRIIFGRRGTGKTHVMSFVADTAKKNGENRCKSPIPLVAPLVTCFGSCVFLTRNLSNSRLQEYGLILM